MISLISWLISISFFYSQANHFFEQVRFTKIRSLGERTAQQSVNIRYFHIAAKGTKEFIGLDWTTENTTKKKKGISFHADAV